MAIAEHPDVRRMLWTMRALALGGRLLVLYAALHQDDPRGALLIPVAKAWCTDAGVEAASLGVQVHGGMGFVEETGAAQILRDIRITPIYEGTNGIQALTLLRRGLLRDQGAALSALLSEIAEVPALTEMAAATGRAGEWLRLAAPREAESGASPFLAMLGTLAAGWLCSQVVAQAEAPAAARSAAGIFISQLLPRIHGLEVALTMPDAPMVGARSDRLILQEIAHAPRDLPRPHGRFWPGLAVRLCRTGTGGVRLPAGAGAAGGDDRKAAGVQRCAGVPAGPLGVVRRQLRLSARRMGTAAAVHRVDAGLLGGRPHRLRLDARALGLTPVD